MPATLTPLRYPGGKTKYTNLFVDIISMNKLDNCTFVEVFAGGAGAAISLLLKGHVNSLILNDLDIAIYAFWKSVKECPAELIQLIRSTRISMAEWRRQKEIYDSKNTSDMLALAFSTFYLNRCNRSGILGARPIGGMKQDGDYRLSSRYNKTTSIAKIKAIAKHANSIDIFNLDGVSFLKLLKQKYPDRKCLIYFDPPYYQKGPALYLNHFSHKDHKSLRDYILRCPFPWILSYDNHENIIDMYRDHDCNLYRNSIRHTIMGNTKAEELIISRLNLPDYLDQHLINTTELVKGKDDGHYKGCFS
jgi:DNA adenine methylase